MAVAPKRHEELEVHALRRLDTSDSAYQQRRPLSVSVAPRSATPGAGSTSVMKGPPAIFSSAVGRTSNRCSAHYNGPCGTTKTANEVPGVVKQEEPEVAESSAPAVPVTQPSVEITTGPRCLSRSHCLHPVREVMHPLGHQYLLTPVLVVDLLSEEYLSSRRRYHSKPRQLPTPPLSGVLEPPELLGDQAKVKYWWDRALQAEPRLADRDRQVQKQNAEILDLSWKAKVAEDGGRHTARRTLAGVRWVCVVGTSPALVL